MFHLQVTIGNLHFQVGYLKYTTSEADTMLAFILGPCLGILLAIIVIVTVLIYFKKTHRGPFRKKELHTVRYRPGSRVDQADGRRGRDLTYRLDVVEENRKLLIR